MGVVDGGNVGHHLPMVVVGEGPVRWKGGLRSPDTMRSNSKLLGKPLSEPLAQGFAQGRINFDERPQREGAAICGKATGVTKLSGGVVGRNLSGWYR